MAAEVIRVPDIGNFTDVPVIEVLVAPGDTVEVDDPILTLESDKATMDVPSPFAGTIGEIKVKEGDSVSMGTEVCTIETAGGGAAPAAAAPAAEAAPVAPAAGGGAGGGSTEVSVPDIGNFTDVPVIEVLVSVGDTIAVDDPVLTLESDKATMDVPATVAGTVTAVKVKEGDTVSQGTVILEVAAEGGAAPAAAPAAAAPAAASAPAAAPSNIKKGDQHAEVLVLGAGPGGYTAAFRAADLGKQVIMIDSRGPLGGVCLNVGCIPSKALLHAAKVISETKEMAEHGVSFSDPSVDIDKLRSWKDGVVSRLTGGLGGLAKQRKVTTIVGHGKFTGPNEVTVTAEDGSTSTVSFDQAIIAAGSEPVTLPFVPHDDPRVIDSTGALAMERVPESMLVLGGGIIGLEMATVYAELGTKISIVELMDQIIPGADADLVKPLQKMISKKYENIWLGTKVTGVTAGADGLTVTFEGKNAPESATFDSVLVAVGRKPNGAVIGADAAGVAVTDRGFIEVDKAQRTNVPHIFAIGDVVGQPMLAHKAVHEGKVAAENTAGQDHIFDAMVIPSVAYTDPEVAWVGVTETQAKAEKRKIGKAAFPWAASGRSLSLGRDEGITKVIFDEETDRIIGCGIVGPNAGDLIAEAALAIEMGCDAADIGLTIHPHPTLSETVAMAAEAFEGTITDLYMPKKKK